MDNGLAPTNNTANNFKQIVNSVSSENRELPISLNTIADNFFYVLESKLFLEFEDLNILKYHTEVFNNFFRELHPYNSYIVQDWNTFENIFKGTFLFINDSTVIHLYKSQVFNAAENAINTFPRMIKLNLEDVVEVPLSKLYIPFEVIPSNADLFNKLSRLKEWLKENLEQEILPSVEFSTKAILDSNCSDVQSILETVAAQSDLIIHSHSSIILDQSIAELFSSLF